MGIGTSSSKLEVLIKNTQILLDGISGRILDLPCGDELHVIRNIYDLPFNTTSLYSENYLKFIGRAYSFASNRKFYIYLSKNMSVLGYEPETGLHFLSKSLQMFLNENGLNNRDLKVVNIKVLNADYKPLFFPNPKTTLTRCVSNNTLHGSVCNDSNEELHTSRLMNTSRFCEHQLECGSIIDLVPESQPSECLRKECNASSRLYKKRSESIKSVFF
ncbi:myristylated tegument protein CIRC [Canid alphaherpesvirus 1]|uniref:Myristylated tegument protein CIRC n=1 Tax=Canid alphaherpesvirus 1 TaxID=170325 RepID=A0A172DSN8_9ALPH|nr:myristylated tegument protein CIRC [Canid alphaherpesvirus 1]ALL25879.1 myristylated tegument protein CIRC [Canid alphaherpesvirus 1]ALL25959.1 myristylated tegument protein CIRC [Canid alphaherpesvirus 1]ALL26035.1 myristylated tegument protein CIRC [Canid alphaherpesvirus 1]ARE29807.1 myristylated tegument protein CIRC [Canid alphaherpesvirus 1]QQL08546.1 myristylated tegument protein CIRC [Canid alphaherpesvirus 1]